MCVLGHNLFLESLVSQRISLSKKLYPYIFLHQVEAIVDILYLRRLFFFAYSNTFKFSESSRIKESFIVDLIEDNSNMNTCGPTVLCRIRDEQRADVSVDATHSRVCNTRLNVVPS